MASEGKSFANGIKEMGQEMGQEIATMAKSEAPDMKSMASSMG